jgi:hypothetical protein
MTTIECSYTAVTDRRDRPEEYIQAEIKVRRLVEAGNISEARKEIATIPAGASETLDKWKRLLAEPVVTQGKTASGLGMRLNLLWLDNFSEKYKGEWVALKQGQLIGHNPSRIALQIQLEELDSLEGTTFFKIEG